MSQYDESVGNPEEVVHQQFNKLRGRLCGLIESWNMPEKQERACISTLKSLTYDSEQVLADLIIELERY